jgi:hypothetical protein
MKETKIIEATTYRTVEEGKWFFDSKQTDQLIEEDGQSKAVPVANRISLRYHAEMSAEPYKVIHFSLEDFRDLKRAVDYLSDKLNP